MSETNQNITEWLGDCWHEWEKPYLPHYPGIVTCRKCKVGRDGLMGGHFNRAFDSDPAAMVELIEAVRAKGCEMTLESESNQPYFARVYSTRKQDSGEPWTYTGEAATLPAAVAAAVIKLIDAQAASPTTAPENVA